MMVTVKRGVSSDCVTGKSTFGLGETGSVSRLDAASSGLAWWRPSDDVLRYCSDYFSNM